VVSADDHSTVVLVQHALVLDASGTDADALVVSDDVVITLALPSAADALAVAHGGAHGELTVIRSTRAEDDLPERYPATTSSTPGSTGTTRAGGAAS
jgi:hypothetical protein